MASHPYQQGCLTAANAPEYTQSETPTAYELLNDKDAWNALLNLRDATQWEACYNYVAQIATSALFDYNDVEDAVQDALICIWKALPKFLGNALLTTWLHKITKRVVYRYNMRRGSKSHQQVELEHVEAEQVRYGWQTEQLTDAHIKVAYEALRRFLREQKTPQLVARNAQILNMALYEATELMSIKQIAQHVGVEPRRVYQILQEARQTVLDTLSDLAS